MRQFWQGFEKKALQKGSLMYRATGHLPWIKGNRALEATKGFQLKKKLGYTALGIGVPAYGVHKFIQPPPTIGEGVPQQQ